MKRRESASARNPGCTGSEATSRPIGADGTVRYAGTGADGLTELRDAIRREVECFDASNAPFADALWADGAALEIRRFVAPGQVGQENRIKRALYGAWTSGKGTARARRVSTTLEGDPILEGLVVDSGEIVYVADNRRDRFGTPRVLRAQVERLELGDFDASRKGRFVRVGRRAPPSAALVIRCMPQGTTF